jgi:hypothetical protein
MKYSWLNEDGPKAPFRINHRGAVREVWLRSPSPREVAEADRSFKVPPVPSDADPAAVADFFAAVLARNCYFAALALGPENFTAQDLAGQMQEISAEGDGFSPDTIAAIAKEAYQRTRLTPEQLEEADGKLRPIGSSPATA